jgi:hypothetical protein
MICAPTSGLIAARGGCGARIQRLAPVIDETIRVRVPLSGSMDQSRWHQIEELVHAALAAAA